MKPIEPANRRKIIIIPSRLILDVFSNGILQNEFISIPSAVALPKSAKALAVRTDYMRQAVAMLVEDKSFEPVAEGCEYPILQSEWSTVVQRIKMKDATTATPPAKSP